MKDKWKQIKTYTIFDWPPAASHLFALILGTLLTFYGKEEPDLVKRLRSGEVLIKPYGKLKKRLIDSQVGSYAYFKKKDAKSGDYCQLVDIPVSVEWMNSKEPIIALRLKDFNMNMMAVLKKNISSAIVLSQDKSEVTCFQKPNIYYR